MKINFKGKLKLKRLLMLLGILVFFTLMVWHYWPKEGMTWDRWVIGSVFIVFLIATYFWGYE
jgi:hypothetical protein